MVFGRNMTSPAHFEGSEISREHFALFSRHGAVYVQNLSSNGTLINGESAPQSRPKKLNEGDVIIVPGYEIELEKHPSPPPLPKSADPWSAKPARADRPGSLTAWELMVVAAAIGSFILIVYYVIS